MIPRTYSDATTENIIRAAGVLPNSKVAYRGHPFAFGSWCRIVIKGNYFIREVPFLDATGTEKRLTLEIQKEMIPRHMALQRHLEHAAYQYKFATAWPEGKNPSEWIDYFRNVKKACEKLIQKLARQDFRNFRASSSGFFSTPLGGTDNTFLESTVDEALKEILKLRDDALKFEQAHRSNLRNPSSRRGGDYSLYRLAAALCVIWKDILGKEIKASVNAHDERMGGPLVRFLQETTRPLGINKTAHSWRAILRVVKPNLKKYLV